MRRGYKGPARTLSQQGPQGRERREHQEGCNGWKWLIAVLDGGKHSMARSWGETSGAWWENIGRGKGQGEARGEVQQGGQGESKSRGMGRGLLAVLINQVADRSNDKNYATGPVRRKSTAAARKLFCWKVNWKVQGREALEQGSNNQP